MSEPPQPLISITPEPTPQELAAIVAAVTAAMTPPVGEDLVSSRNGSRSLRWSRQGRHEAMRGLDREPGATDPLPGRGR